MDAEHSRRVLATLLPLFLLHFAVHAQVNNYIVGPQDVLAITLFDQQDLSGKYTVEADGTFTFPLIGRVKAGGMAHRLEPGGVVFAGFVPPHLLAEYYCAADVYVHCSDNEPHSLAITEAIYCGLPVVLSDRCGSYGPTDDVQPGINGFVYRCGDVSDLSRCIVHALEEHDSADTRRELWSHHRRSVGGRLSGTD